MTSKVPVLALVTVLAVLVAIVDSVPLNVHVIAHTHDDVGWLKTVDQYYMGSNESIQVAGVQYILDTVVQSLLSHPERRFIYVEQGFFSRWWREQNDEKKAQVRSLVAKGQLEMINGGWSMNDEACTHYQAVTTNMELGGRYILNAVGAPPKIGWHIDPFGHANTMATIMSQIGYNGFFYARIDYEDYQQRVAKKTTESVWRPSKSFGSASDIYTGVLFDTTYCYPPGLHFEDGRDPPVQDNPLLEDMNVKELSDNFVNFIRRQHDAYPTNNIMITFGCDFQYMNADINFKNMDKLIKYINANPSYDMKLFYSTPTTYIDYIHSENITFTVKTDDLFPYGSGPHSYWTGYFTSRPALKGYVRTRSHLLHLSELMYSIVPSTIPVKPYKLPNLLPLEKAVGVTQHHDAVSGTAKQHVTDDYAKRLSIGSALANKMIGDITGALLSKATGDAPALTFCPLLNESKCDALADLDKLKAGEYIPIVLYNTLAWNRDTTVRVPVGSGSYKVSNGTKTVPSEVHNEYGSYWLYFKASLPATGFKVYFIGSSTSAESSRVSIAAATTIENEYYSINFSPDGTSMTSVLNKKTGKTTTMNNKIMFYEPATETDGQASGAYIFRPLGSANEFLPITTTADVQKGSIVQQVTQVVRPWLKQTIRLYAGENRIEVASQIGPIDISNKQGKEIIVRFSTDLKNGKTFYTDSMGQEFQERILDHRFSYNNTITEPIGSNYYPINAMAYIQDKAQDVQLTWLTDRSRGGSSLSEGQLETMLHRRDLWDDHFGVGEALNETTKIYTTDQVIVSSIKSSPSEARTLAQYQLNPVTMAFGAPTLLTSWQSRYNNAFSGVTRTLPANVYLQTFRPILYPEDSEQYLIRLHHLYQVGEDDVLAKPVTVRIKDLFVNKTPTSIEEYNLTGTVKKADVKRYKWRTTGKEEEPIKFDYKSESPKDEWDIVLSPMETRTFIVSV